jgi:hypothetical protein
VHFCRMGAKKEVERELAKRLFLDDKLTFKEVAIKVGVTEKTISNWAKADKWQEINRSLLVTKDVQIASLYDQLEWLNQDIKRREIKVATSKEADAISKITSAINRLETETSTGDAIEVMRKFMTYLSVNNRVLLKELEPSANAYIMGLFK